MIYLVLTLSIVASSYIKVSRQRDFYWLMFTVGESRPIFVMHIMYNAVKRLRDGLASRHLSALSAIYVYSSNVMN